MKKTLLLFVVLTFVYSCSSVKQTQKALNTGNYDQAIAVALKKLRANKAKKGNQPHILILEEAYAKVVERDVNAVNYMEQEANPANLERIYNMYRTLKKRQESIKPLLPLYVNEQARNAVFKMEDYDQRILATKEKLSQYLYDKANTALINASVKTDYRQVYNDLIHLDKINPNYRNTKSLIEEAHFKGTDFVIVTMQNRTNMVIPRRLESDLLNFNTYGLNDLWTVYHSAREPNITYDYAMNIALREINISPEKITERQLQRERTVKDGWKYLLDENGKIVVDDEGKKVKVDKMVKVLCEYYEFTQFKAVNVAGNVRYRNLSTNRVLKTFPIASENVFEHIYATYDGDKRALEEDLVRFLGMQAVDFPSNEQMVYDTGEDLKLKIKRIITNYSF